jgi:3,4-dihydroxy-2-butanone 4-phosphate synthase
MISIHIKFRKLCCDIKIGKTSQLIVDDRGQGKEGDFVAAAEKATPEMINSCLKKAGDVLRSYNRKKM